jgi:hypothetical protein
MMTSWPAHQTARLLDAVLLRRSELGVECPLAPWRPATAIPFGQEQKRVCMRECEAPDEFAGSLEGLAIAVLAAHGWRDTGEVSTRTFEGAGTTRELESSGPVPGAEAGGCGNASGE